MKNLKQLGVLTLALVTALIALTGCGNKDSSFSSAPSGSSSSSSGSAIQTPSMDLSTITDPYLAVSGLAGDEVVATLGGQNIPAAELVYWFNRTVGDYYTNTLGGQLVDLPWDAAVSDSLTLGQMLVDKAMETTVAHCLLRRMAEDEGISPDPSISSDLSKEYVNLVVQAGSDETRVIHTLWIQLLTKDMLTQLNEDLDLYNQLAELYFGETSGHSPTEAEIMAWLDENGYFRVKHILLMTVDQTTNDPLDEDAIAQKKAVADELLSQLRDSSDPVNLFDQLMNEYSEDGGLATNPDGYTFNASSSLIGGFREATLALSLGEISDVVETDYGYHILLRLPIDPASHRSGLINDLMKEKMDQREDELGVIKTASFDQFDPADTWNQILALQTAIQTELQAAMNGQ